jgi:hypothetical protein
VSYLVALSGLVCYVNLRIDEDNIVTKLLAESADVPTLGTAFELFGVCFLISTIIVLVWGWKRSRKVTP